jgi:hypothetical protein
MREQIASSKTLPAFDVLQQAKPDRRLNDRQGFAAEDSATLALQCRQSGLLLVLARLAWPQ